MALPTGALVVFALVGVAVVLFVLEPVPPDITAIGVLVSLAVLEPLTQVPATEAIAGFASPAVVTIVAMYILSSGLERTGVVGWLGGRLARFTRGSERRLLGATTASTGVFAGLVNNTPVVAVFVPVVTGLADDIHVSPSKFLLPLSFAAMLGGTLTLVGSSINLLASDVLREAVGRPLGMFEITPVGVVVLVAGLAYLLTVGYRLTPARRAPRADVVESYGLGRRLAQVRVREGSPLVGRTPTELYLDETLGFDFDLDVLQVDRRRERVVEDNEEGLRSRTVTDSYIAGSGQRVAAGDVLTVRASRQEVNRFAEAYDLRQLPRERVESEDLEGAHPGILTEVVVPPSSGLVGTTPTEARLAERFRTQVLALRRGGTVTTADLADRPIETGDTLLLRTTEPSVDFLREEGDVIPVSDRSDAAADTIADADRAAGLAADLDAGPGDADGSSDTGDGVGLRAPLSVGILLGAVLLAAATPLAIPVTALGGVVAMVVTGCLNANEAYDAVSWNVVFLLAGILPLGVALQRTGGAAVLGEAIGGLTGGLPPVAALGAVYLLAAGAASVVTPVATVVLLGPVAVDTAATIGASALPFVLSVLFGASAAYISPIGYQTNLMVYGPGGYRFTDYTRVGLPLVALLAVVSTATIALLYGV
ncbi:SLC13 family permease [Salinirussus salinus]|jgi:di/tricarboxylate transporter|uniref:SLC13 family permease n=1 Tax=Salinirussus salinus TaxID=1198300 RepID=UPI001359259A|nr:SLC13 family permease [Salinirussus salinus]